MALASDFFYPLFYFLALRRLSPGIMIAFITLIKGDNEDKHDDEEI